MPEQKSEKFEREYIIPLRREWQKVANYRRTGRAVKEIKKFIAKHMKVPDRDFSKVKEKRHASSSGFEYTFLTLVNLGKLLY